MPLLLASPILSSTALPQLHNPPPLHCEAPKDAKSPVATALQTTCRELQALIASSQNRRTQLRGANNNMKASMRGGLASPIELRPKTSIIPLQYARTTSRVQKPASVLRPRRERRDAGKSSSLLLRAAQQKKSIKPAAAHLHVPEWPQVPIVPRHLEASGEETATLPSTPASQITTAPPVLPQGLRREDFDTLPGKPFLVSKGRQRQWQSVDKRREEGELGLGLGRYDEAVV
ncbi:MAG: hypothetical protein Q9181_005504, partial [Wetmoreana brouardii]